jgi:hypothetical protein
VQMLKLDGQKDAKLPPPHATSSRSSVEFIPATGGDYHPAYHPAKQIALGGKIYTSNIVHPLNDGMGALAPATTLDVEPDGNCFFRTFSMWYTGKQDWHEEFREMMVYELKRHFGLYRAYVDEKYQKMAPASYFDRVSKSGVWVTAAEIYALATYLGVCIQAYIYIVDIGTKPMWVPTAPIGKSDNQIECVYMQLYKKHYNCVNSFAFL